MPKNNLIVFPQRNSSTPGSALPERSRIIHSDAPPPARAVPPQITVPGIPNYLGHLMCLNPERAERRFQCGGFLIGGRITSAVVDEKAQQYQIHQAVLSGVLIDLTATGGIVASDNSQLGSIAEVETDKKVYFCQTAEGDAIIFATSDTEQKAILDERLKTGSTLVLPEGWEDQEKYALSLDKPESPGK